MNTISKQENLTINILSGLTILSVGIVCLLSFALSYDVLWNHALAGGKPEWLAPFWPLIIDIPIIAFSLIAMLLSMLGKDTRLSRFGVLAATLLTIGFNYRYAINHNLDWKVAIVAPIMYAASFEFMIIVVGILTNRGLAIKKVNSIQSELDSIQGKWQVEQDKIDSERGKLNGQLDSLKGQIEQARQTVSQLETQQRQVDQGAIFEYLPDNLPMEIRQQVVKKMVNQGETIKSMADYLGVSEGTIKNDKKAIFSVNGHGN